MLLSWFFPDLRFPLRWLLLHTSRFPAKRVRESRIFSLIFVPVSYAVNYSTTFNTYGIASPSTTLGIAMTKTLLLDFDVEFGNVDAGEFFNKKKNEIAADKNEKACKRTGERSFCLFQFFLVTA